jgi:REP-associated tyrosine transposase
VPRQPRLRVPGGVYHVTSRGNRRQVIFLDDRDRRYFLKLLAEVVQRYGWRCHAFCLMDNHYHLVIETPEPNISEGMHRLNSKYADWFNRRHALDGHLFQDRFYSTLVGSEWHLLELARYVVLNAVRAGLCGAPGEWRWSSYGATAGLERRPKFLTTSTVLAQFGRDAGRACSAYAQFVREGLSARKLAS